ncbi:MAG: AAA family ATPase, partial [Okeania sp. SIO2H7]|nr:AAA family ATPase [Okeania sp. SIO2H7]
MIPSDIRLYTWVDVEDVLLQIDDWPKWLVSARPYWRELSIEISPGTQEKAKEWLRKVFEPRFRPGTSEEMADCFIILESLKGEEKTLSVWFEETEEKSPLARITPSLSRPGVIFAPPKDVEPPQNLPDDFPPVVAFHSFKGGVGRTTNLLALAQALTNEKKRVLVIDGDLEAPGISWMLEEKLPNPSVCFADFLALAHWDPSSLAEEAVRLVSDRLKNALIDGIYFLPAFRSIAKFTKLEIKPEHLIKGDPNAFLLTEILANLGKALGVDVVLIDLRSGLSELATGLILDPRVYRVFVTTLSEQSLEGTKQLLEIIGNRALSTAEENPLPALIFTKVPRERSQDWVAEPEQRLLEVMQPFLGEDRNQELMKIVTPFTDNLLILPRNWEDVKHTLQHSEIVEKVRVLLEWLPTNISQPIKKEDLKSKRKLLKEQAEQLVYAETSKIADFFATTPLKNLASRYQNSLPVAVIVGAKGSGKTYTFLQIVRRKNWKTFAEDAGATEVVNAFIAPILE